MKKSCMLIALFMAGLFVCAQAASPRPADAGLGRRILLYVPDRIFDLLDVFRLRVRVGPGISVGVRATRPVSAYVGFHSSVFAGLHGPRGRRMFPWPAGLDMGGGVQVSVAKAGGSAVYYDPLEVGFELQPLIVGLNFGIGVFEILDFATGLLMIDLQDDDFGSGSLKKEEPQRAEGRR